jgi:hypothetical protein
MVTGTWLVFYTHVDLHVKNEKIIEQNDQGRLTEGGGINMVQRAGTFTLRVSISTISLENYGGRFYQSCAYPVIF